MTERVHTEPPRAIATDVSKTKTREKPLVSSYKFYKLFIGHPVLIVYIIL